MNILHHRPIARRTFLRGAGVSLALPWLESMSSLARAASTAGGIAESERPKRAIFTMWGLGINGRDFTPAKTGRDWNVTPILKPVSHLRDDFTLISGLKLTHSGGHGGDRTFLTGISTHKADAKLRISADQELAEAVGKATRFSSLVLGVHPAPASAAAPSTRLSRGRAAARPSPPRTVRILSSTNSFAPKAPPRSPPARSGPAAPAACSTPCATRPSACKTASAKTT